VLQPNTPPRAPDISVTN